MEEKREREFICLPRSCLWPLVWWHLLHVHLSPCISRLHYLVSSRAAHVGDQTPHSVAERSIPRWVGEHATSVACWGACWGACCRNRGKHSFRRVCVRYSSAHTVTNVTSALICPSKPPRCLGHIGHIRFPITFTFLELCFQVLLTRWTGC